MDRARVVELHSGGDQGHHGSGFLLAQSLVLTARHVVEGLQGTRVRFLELDEDGFLKDVGPWQDARIIWQSPDTDLALLQPGPGRSGFKAMREATTVAKLEGRASVPVDAIGFPRAMQVASYSDLLRIEASVDPLTGARHSSLVLSVATARPAEDQGWRGMSGAAVFAGDRLVGVIKEVPGTLDESVLRATPAHSMFANDDAAALLERASVRLGSPVDAAYVGQLPKEGHWRGLQDRYSRAVVKTLCRVDHVGLAVGGAPDARKPALAVFTGWRLRSNLSASKLLELSRAFLRLRARAAGFL